MQRTQSNFPSKSLLCLICPCKLLLGRLKKTQNLPLPTQFPSFPPRDMDLKTVLLNSCVLISCRISLQGTSLPGPSQASSTHASFLLLLIVSSWMLWMLLFCCHCSLPAGSQGDINSFSVAAEVNSLPPLLVILMATVLSGLAIY